MIYENVTHFHLCFFLLTLSYVQYNLPLYLVHLTVTLVNVRDMLTLFFFFPFSFNHYPVFQGESVMTITPRDTLISQPLSFTSEGLHCQMEYSWPGIFSFQHFEYVIPVSWASSEKSTDSLMGIPL